MKKPIVVLLLFVVALSGYFFVSNEANKEIELSNENKIATNDSESIVNDHVDIEIPDGPDSVVGNTTVDYEVESVDYYKKCNLMPGSHEAMLESWDMTISDLSELQLEALKRLKNEEYCEEWYGYVESLSDEEIDELKSLTSNRLDKTAAFLSAEMGFGEKEELAKSVLRKESDALTDITAIVYLMKNDYEFQKLIGERINTKNFDLISNSSSEVVMIYQCHSNPALCSKKGRLMTAKCFVNADHCNLDYFGFLQQNRTLNEVADLQNMSDALREVLRQDYFYN